MYNHIVSQGFVVTLLCVGFLLHMTLLLRPALFKHKCRMRIPGRTWNLHILQFWLNWSWKKLSILVHWINTAAKVSDPSNFRQRRCCWYRPRVFWCMCSEQLLKKREEKKGLIIFIRKRHNLSEAQTVASCSHATLHDLQVAFASDGGTAVCSARKCSTGKM